MTDNVPTPHPEDQQDTYTDLTARLAAADLGWSHEHGDPPASPDYIKRLAFQVMAFKPPLIAGVYVDDEMLDDMRDRLHGDNCGCGEWDSHSQEYVERMDETIHAVLYPLRHPVRPVPRGTEGSDYREQIARALLASSDSRTDLSGTHDIQIIPADAAADLYERFVSPLVEQLRQARAAYNRMAGHAVDRAAERDRYYLAWQSAARGRRGVRAELDAVGRAIECFLGVEYGTPVESARALVERCADAERALDGLRTTAVVLPEDWRQMLADGDYPEQVVDLIESWRAAPVVEFEAADSPSPVSKSSQTAAPVEAETPDEHVREHDDAAPTRDEVAEEWADTWDGVDRTPEWVRVVEPCPVPECTIPQVHGHEGYGLRFTPAAQPAHPRPPLDPPPNSLNERLRIRRSEAPGTGQWGARWPGSAWVTNLGEAQARIEVERHAKAGAVLVWRESKDHDWAEVASPGTGTEAGE